MGTNWRPSWWKEEMHGSAWERVREVVRRDWEQTKRDPNVSGERQDTLRHANNQPFSRATLGTWDEAEVAYGYGHGARRQYGEHTQWTNELENKLRTEWTAGKAATTHAWDDVKQFVRRGFEFNDGSPPGSPKRH